MIDDQDIILYSAGGRIFQLVIKYYDVYEFKKNLIEYDGASIELYDDGFPPTFKNIDNIYFAVFKTAADAAAFKLKYGNFIA